MTKQLKTIQDIISKTRNLLAFHQDCGLEYPASSQAPAPKPTVKDKDLTPDKADKATPDKAPHSLAMIEKDVADCQGCSLHQSKKLQIKGEISPGPKLLIIIDPEKDPEKVDDFITRQSRELLGKMMGAIKLNNNDFTLVPLVRCLPEKNPAAQQAKECLPFVSRVINNLQPQIICCMGPLASQTMLHSNKQLPSLRGRFHHWQNTPLIATYHPTLLRKHQELKKASWHDLQLIQHQLDSSR